MPVATVTVAPVLPSGQAEAQLPPHLQWFQGLCVDQQKEIGEYWLAQQEVMIHHIVVPSDNNSNVATMYRTAAEKAKRSMQTNAASEAAIEAAKQQKV